MRRKNSASLSQSYFVSHNSKLVYNDEAPFPFDIRYSTEKKNTK